MMSIWKQTEMNLEKLNAFSKNTLAETLHMQFTSIGNDYLEMQMPVDTKVHQPYGLLHGGASAALAETIGSMASWLCIDQEQQICVGMEINCNHIRAKRNGIITAKAAPLHIGATSHVWDIRITDESKNLICISRLTVAVLQKKKLS